VLPILLNWNFKILVFQEWGKPENPEKNPRGKVHCAISAAGNISYALIYQYKFNLWKFAIQGLLSCTVLDAQLSVLSPQSYPCSLILCSKSLVLCPGSSFLGALSLILWSVSLTTCLQIQHVTSEYFVHDVCWTCIKTMCK